MTNKIIRIVSCDTETTSLAAHTGHAWQLGIAWVDYDATKGLVIRRNPGLQDSIRIPEDFWDRETLAFTKKHHRPGTIQPWATNTVKDVLFAKTNWRLMIEPVTRTDYPVYWVFNHPDFDVPFIEHYVPDFKKLVGHRNILDLQSLMLGSLGFKGATAAYGKHRAAVGQTTHNALEDAESQLALIINNKLLLD